MPPFTLSHLPVIVSIYYVQGDLKVFMHFHTSMEMASNEGFIVLFFLSLEPRQGFGLISFLIRGAIELLSQPFWIKESSIRRYW